MDKQKSDFLQSVEAFSHTDARPDSVTDRNAGIRTAIIRISAILLCLAVFAYSAGTIILNSLDTEEVNELYESIRPTVAEPEVKPDAPLAEPAPMYTLLDTLGSDSEYMDYLEEIVTVEDQTRRSSYYRNFLKFDAQYQDAYAWIYVDHTRIDYPVMKTTDNEFYLAHNFNKAPSSSGSIVADATLYNDYVSNTNAVFYGHCMKNGTMFRTLKTFMESASRNTLAKTMNIEIYTSEGLYIYEVLSGYRTDNGFFTATNFRSESTYAEFLKKITSLNTLAVSPSYDTLSKICTLMTCANVTSNEEERYVLHGVLVEFIPASKL